MTLPLRTSRLVLEPLVAEHAAEMFAVLSDPAIYRHEGTPPRSEQALRAHYAALERRRGEEGIPPPLECMLRAGDAGPIGYVRALLLADASAGLHCALSSRHWGHGYAQEALQALMATLMSAYGVSHCFATVRKSNVRSVRLLHRLGFSSVGPGHPKFLLALPGEFLMLRELSADAG